MFKSAGWKPKPIFHDIVLLHSDSGSVTTEKAATCHLPRDHMSLPSNVPLNDLSALTKGRESSSDTPAGLQEGGGAWAAPWCFHATKKEKTSRQFIHENEFWVNMSQRFFPVHFHQWTGNRSDVCLNQPSKKKKRGDIMRKSWTPEKVKDSPKLLGPKLQNVLTWYWEGPLIGSGYQLSEALRNEAIHVIIEIERKKTEEGWKYMWKF